MSGSTVNGSSVCGGSVCGSGNSECVVVVWVC